MKQVLRQFFKQTSPSGMCLPKIWIIGKGSEWLRYEADVNQDKVHSTRREREIVLLQYGNLKE